MLLLLLDNRGRPRMVLEAVRMLLTLVPSVDVAELQNADVSVNHSSQTANFKETKYDERSTTRFHPAACPEITMHECESDDLYIVDPESDVFQSQ